MTHATTLMPTAPPDFVPGQSLAPGRAARRATATQTRPCRLLCVTSASAGAGVTVLSALSALWLARSGRRTGLMDAHPLRGGIDISLGMEADPGLRWSDVKAPLGQLEPSAFVQELLHWQGVDVISATPWRDACPKDWEISAVYDALCQEEEWLVIDGEPCQAAGIGGRSNPTLTGGGGFGSRPDQSDSAGSAGYSSALPVTHLVLIELSVLGIGRAKGLIERWCADGELETPQSAIYLAVPAAQACGRRKTLIALERASAYLGVDFLASLTPDARLEKGITAGLGISQVPRSYERLLTAVFARVEAVGHEV